MADTSMLDLRVAKLGTASRRAAILSLMGFLVVLGAFGYATWELRDLEKQIQDRKADLAALDAWKKRLAEANDSLSAAVRAATPTVAAQPVVRSAENAKYSVGLYGFAVSNEGYEHVRSTLQADGYAISQGDLLDDRPTWLSPRSSVLYYDEASRKKALSIATELSKVAGAEFAVAKGAGLGVIKGQERWTFFVHYVGK
jgi:cell division protein FtsB